MSERQHGPIEEHEKKKEAIEEAVDDVRTLAVQELAAVIGHDRTPDLALLVDVFRRYPAQRDALMAAVHRLLGNAVAVEVATALAPAAAAEGAAIDEAAGREPPVGTAAVEGPAPGPTTTQPGNADDAVIQTDPAGTTAAKDMREGGVVAVSESQGVEERLGEAAPAKSEAPPDAANGVILVPGGEVQVDATEQITLEAAAIVDRDAVLAPYTAPETFHAHLEELPLSAESRSQLMGVYAEMDARAPEAEVIEEPVEDEIREQI